MGTARQEQRAIEQRVIGARLKTERKKRGWFKPDMARALTDALIELEERQHPDLQTIANYVKRWEAGKFGVSRRYRAAYCRAFDMSEDALFGAGTGTGSMEEQRLPSKETDRLPPGKTAGQAPGEGDEDMERRRLLQALAALGVASVPALSALAEIRDGVDRALGRDEDSHLDEWDEAIAEYGYTYTLTPPRRLFEDLAADLVVAQQAMSRYQRGENSSSWSRVMAGLGMLMAKTLCNLGQPRLARPWWVTAQQAADDSGDTNLALWTRTEELIHGLYDRRPTPILLARADEIAARAAAARVGPCQGLAQISTARAQILALDGHPDAVAELRRAAEVTERLPGSVPADPRTMAGWSENRVAYTEAWVHAYLGDRDRLDAAVGRTLALLPAFHRSRAQVQLLQAFGHIKAGDVTEGVRQATVVYEAQPVEHRAAMVQSLAEQVLAAVPAHHTNSGLAADYRELLVQLQPKAIT